MRDNFIIFVGALILLGNSLFGVSFFSGPFNQSAFAEPAATPVGLSSTPSLRQFSSRKIESQSPEQRTKQKSFQLNEEGVELVLQGQHSDGIAKIRQALETDPTNSTALYNLSGLLLIEGAAAEAVKSMEQAVAQKPEDLSFLNRLAEAHVANSDIDKAISTYERIEKINPRYEQTLTRLGSLYGMKQEWGKAEATLRKAIQFNNEDGRAWGNLGSVLYMRKQYSESAQAFDTAIKLADSPENRVGLGLARAELGELNLALENFEKAKALGSDDLNLDSHIQGIRKKLATP